MIRSPARILLTTDLSARCDRALDRAVQLAGAWQAELIALSVIEASLLGGQARPSRQEEAERIARARQQLCDDLGDPPVRATVRIERGDVLQAVRQVTAETGAGLVVAGMARNEALGRFLLGSTTERMASHLLEPLLVVRRRVKGAYRRIVIANDFSPASAEALRVAATFFTGAEIHLFHAAPEPVAEAAAPFDVDRSLASFLGTLGLAPAVTAAIRLGQETGRLFPALAAYVEQHAADLVCVGTHGRSRLMDALLGNTASRLLHRLPCDTLVVHEGWSAAGR